MPTSSGNTLLHKALATGNIGIIPDITASSTTVSTLQDPRASITVMSADSRADMPARRGIFALFLRTTYGLVCVSSLHGYQIRQRESIEVPQDYADLANVKPLPCKGIRHQVSIIRRSAWSAVGAIYVIKHV